MPEYITGDDAAIWRVAKLWEAYSGFDAMPENAKPMTREDAAEVWR